MHSKEQIVELPVLERFLTILPEKLRAWVREQHPLNGDEAVSLLDDLEREFDDPGFRVGRGVLWWQCAASAGKVHRKAVRAAVSFCPCHAS